MSAFLPISVPPLFEEIQYWRYWRSSGCFPVNSQSFEVNRKWTESKIQQTNQQYTLPSKIVVALGHGCVSHLPETKQKTPSLSHSRGNIPCEQAQATHTSARVFSPMGKCKAGLVWGCERREPASDYLGFCVQWHY